MDIQTAPGQDKSFDQKHGKIFETMVCRSGLFPGSENQTLPPTAMFDIKAQHDLVERIQTSVKATLGSTLALADARAIWSINEPFRMVVGFFRQDEAAKTFHTVWSMVLRAPVLDRWRRGIPMEVVEAFHVGLEAFEPGREVEAQAWARAKNAEIDRAHPNLGLRLNPKIDRTYNQRRLQCSIQLEWLRGVLPDSDLRQDTERYGTIPLPFVIPGGPRRRKPATVDVQVEQLSLGIIATEGVGRGPARPGYDVLHRLKDLMRPTPDQLSLWGA